MRNFLIDSFFVAVVMVVLFFGFYAYKDLRQIAIDTAPEVEVESLPIVEFKADELPPPTLRTFTIDWSDPVLAPDRVFTFPDKDMKWRELLVEAFEQGYQAGLNDCEKGEQ